jgi:hypothetical protein
MKKQLLLIFFFFFSYNCFSQTFQKTYGGANDEFGFSVQQTFDGGFIIVGQTGNVGSFNNDILIIRIDINGDTVWTKTFGNLGDDVGYSVQQTSDGGFVVAGNLDGQNTADILLLRIDSYGNLIWSKSFGGNVYDYGNWARQTFDGGFIVLGSTSSFGAGMYDAYLIKTDSSGDSLWTKVYGGIDNEWGYCVKQTYDSGFVLSGRTSSTLAGDDDGFLIKTNSQGDVIWSKTYGGFSNDAINSVEQTNDGGFIFSGNTSSYSVGAYDLYLTKTDSFGNVIWTKTFGGYGFEGDGKVSITSDGGFILEGAYNPTGTQYWDMYLIKTDSNGNLLWSKTFGGSDSDLGYDIKQTNDEGFIFVGATKNFGSVGFDVYLIKTDSTGNSGCNQTNYPTFTTSPFIQSTNFISSVSAGSIVNTPTLNSGSGFNVSTLCSSVGLNEIISDNQFLIYPNPSQGSFSISSNEMIIKGSIQIYDVFGKNIFKQNIFTSSKQEINLENISAGIYLLKINDGVMEHTAKIIIE